MTLIIEIPKEFENDFKTDRFAECFDRITGDIAYSLKNRDEFDSWGLAGNYEKETCEMLKEAFKTAKVTNNAPRVVVNQTGNNCNHIANVGKLIIK